MKKLFRLPSLCTKQATHVIICENTLKIRFSKNHTIPKSKRKNPQKKRGISLFILFLQYNLIMHKMFSAIVSFAAIVVSFYRHSSFRLFYFLYLKKKSLICF